MNIFEDFKTEIKLIRDTEVIDDISEKELAQDIAELLYHRK